MRSLRVGLVVLAAPLLLSVQVKMSAQQGDAASAGRSPATSSQRQFLDRYCATCHNERLKTGGLSLDQVDVSRPDAQPELWEKVVRKLHTGVMPPPNVPQPPKADRLAMLTWLETSLDAASAAQPESWSHRNAATPESNRVSERDPGPAGARHRRRLASAGR